ncbi:uncharacterized protein PGTG_14878 [Puccinia graminis f. sp. tritici CRL 75-36-700-3]|uniref:Uncharacterized protein n=1 Tax=Puccinia graminis f. sp. tritici (strain CRL 75-36-700-3 / race SCCL) TaxID=418459 RepID=E3KXV1_PUCGT|nr:uncharacterized protein PGTG_14878 [Puccinia graminis f. sp. tritici CRL 75-36-700-3]EFP89037.2 hypothetical protein PGTG_14878 [Puccinia graminis f. sp. tritici CRL 75-36-700-3]
MSISQLDPSLMELTPLAEILAQSPSSGPNVSHLNLGTNLLPKAADQNDSPKNTQGVPIKKGPQPQQTKDKKILYHAEQEQIKKEKAVSLCDAKTSVL